MNKRLAMNSHDRKGDRHTLPAILLTIALCWGPVCWGPDAFAQGDEDLPGGGQATAVNSITMPAGFRAQLLRSAGKGEDSWISMTFDDRGRIILGRDKRGVARLTLNENRSQVENFEVLENTLKHCRGVLWAHDSLYVCATDSSGFYRLRDSDGDDRFESVQLLKSMDYQSRYGHGTNQVVLGPDEMLYIVNGNDVAFPDGVAADSPYRDPQDDHLLPEPSDAVQEVRVGHILRTNADGTTWEVLAGGFRNPFDLAFNSDGQMFTYDADMEWDIGLPWYRPTRLNHVVSGGEYGWRWGTGKWPSYFVDSLPANLETGLGSPTGLEFGSRSSFPLPYRDSLFMGDWQNGRILQVEVTPHGASYDCQYGVFLEGGALNVCDLTFGPDGAMYFITGGRGSQSGLYRVVYEGNGNLPAIVSADDSTSSQDEERALRSNEASAARKLRHELEVFHRNSHPRAVEFAWPHLNSEDRWLRYAARMAIERQDPAQWRERALQESLPSASITALLALVRLGRAADQDDVLAAIERLPWNALSNEQLLDTLRLIALSIVRQGAPSDVCHERLLRRLEPLSPHPSNYVNRELCRLLFYLQSPYAIPRTVQLARDALSQEDAIFYMKLLSRSSEGWTIDTRATFFDALLVARGYHGGHLFSDAIATIREDAISTLTDSERGHLQGKLEQLALPSDIVTDFAQNPMVHQWSFEELEKSLPQVRTNRSWERGRASLAKASCIKCHSIGEQGNVTGPDLTHVGHRFDERALLESIALPSKVIDEKYRLNRYLLDSGEVVTGRPVSVGANSITLQTASLPTRTVEIQRQEIEQTSPADLSPMPSDLLNVLTIDEVLDLIAYLQTGGDPQAEVYSVTSKEQEK